MTLMLPNFKISKYQIIRFNYVADIEETLFRNQMGKNYFCPQILNTCLKFIIKFTQVPSSKLFYTCAIRLQNFRNLYYLLKTNFLPSFRIKKLNDTDVGMQLNPIINVSIKTRVLIELSHVVLFFNISESDILSETTQTLACWLGCDFAN